MGRSPQVRAAEGVIREKQARIKELEGLIENAKRMVAERGAAVCGYSPGHGNADAWPTSRCDCKYGASGRGEQTGCPELRDVYAALSERDDG